MRFFVLNREPIAEKYTARIDALKTEDTKFGDGPRCETCGQFVGMRSWLPPYRVELETWGREFADLVTIGTDLLASLRFKQAWERSRLVGLGGFEDVEVVKVNRHWKAIGDVPAYFRAIVLRSQTAVDLTASEFEWGNAPTCSTCRLGDIIKRWKRIIIDQNTWNGVDVFVARGLPGEIIVSERFKNFCEQIGMTNTVFVPADKYGHDFYPSEKEAV